MAKNYFFGENGYYQEKKAGIYLYADQNIKKAYIIVWPGNLTYKYSTIDEPINNLLLTLVRFGFSLSSNCILCLTDKEVEDFDPDGYKIFESEEETGYKLTRYTVKDKEKIEFRLDEEKLLDTRKIFNDKIIKDLKIKNNYIFSKEKLQDKISKKPKNK